VLPPFDARRAPRAQARRAPRRRRLGSPAASASARQARSRSQPPSTEYRRRQQRSTGTERSPHGPEHKIQVRTPNRSPAATTRVGRHPGTDQVPGPALATTHSRNRPPSPLPRRHRPSAAGSAAQGESGRAETRPGEGTYESKTDGPNTGRNAWMPPSSASAAPSKAHGPTPREPRCTTPRSRTPHASSR